MARTGRPFLFCRYQMTVGEDTLRATAQFNLISELQGRAVAHGERAAEDKNYNTLIMRPKKFHVQRLEAFSWSVGITIGVRITAKYDRSQDKIDLEIIPDGGVKFNDFVAVPSLGVVAVDDRSGDLHIGGKQAINRLMSVIRSNEGADVSVVFEATPEEVRKALTTWTLTKFKFTIQPNNPRPVRRLSQLLAPSNDGKNFGRSALNIVSLLLMEFDQRASGSSRNFIFVHIFVIDKNAQLAWFFLDFFVFCHVGIKSRLFNLRLQPVFRVAS